MQNKNADLTDGLNKHEVALKNSRKALEEEAIVRGAMVSAFGPVQTQVSNLEAKNSSLKDLNQELMQNARSASHKTPASSVIVSPQQFAPVWSEPL